VEGLVDLVDEAHHFGPLSLGMGPTIGSAHLPSTFANLPKASEPWAMERSAILSESTSDLNHLLIAV